MSRGTTEFTVQQLMDYLYEREQELRDENEASLSRIGNAYINGQGGWLTREEGNYKDRAARAAKLEEFRYEVERRCGELYDRKQRNVPREVTNAS